MLFATGTFVVVLKTNVVSAVCARHSRDDVLGSSDALSLRFPMFWGNLTLKPMIFKGLEGSGEFRTAPRSVIFMAFGPWWEASKEGLSLNNSYLRLKTQDLRLKA